MWRGETRSPGVTHECRAHVQERLRLSEEAGLSTHPIPRWACWSSGSETSPPLPRRCRRLGLRPASATGTPSRQACDRAPPTSSKRFFVPRASAEAAAASSRSSTATRRGSIGRSHRPLFNAGAACSPNDDAFDVEFERSLELDALEPSPFERARTQLCWGERLRRVRRRSEARVQLRAARDAFAVLRGDALARACRGRARRNR